MVFLNTVIIDTSTDKSLVVFTHGVDVLLKILLPPGAQSSRHLMGAIESGMEQLHFTPSDLQAIAVGVGPGSYTGIRVGAAAAKGLAFPRSLPLVGICSLAGFISSQEGRFASVIDARIGGAYVLRQERKGGAVIQHDAPRLVSPEELPSYLEGWPNLAGPHLDYPDPHHLANLVAQKLSEHPIPLDLQLLYLRTPHYSITP